MNRDGAKVARKTRGYVMMDFEEIASKIVAPAIKVHTALGPGLLESAYQRCLRYELQKNSLSVKREIMLPIIYEAVRIDSGYRIDMIVEGALSSRTKQLRNYCRSTGPSC